MLLLEKTMLFPLACLLSALAPVHATPADPPAARLVGLWGNETVAAAVEGDLTIDGRDAGWRGAIVGFEAVVQQQGDRLSLALPGGQGQFRGKLSRDRSTVEGFWIQPPGMALASAYATPVVLKRTQPGVWRGAVHPLPERLSQYLAIQREADGALSAFIRNPEFNLAREHVLTVSTDGDKVTFDDPARPGWALHATLDEETGQLRVNWQGIGVFAFTRRDRGHAVGFHARTPAAASWQPRTPLDLADGWPTALPGDVGLDEGRLGALVARLQQTPAAGAPQVQGLLIARHGKLVVEEYFHGFDAARPHDTRSAGKTFAPLLVGLAMAQGRGIGPGAPVLALLPDRAGSAGQDPRKARITVADLMSMTSGLACDDNDPQSPGNEDTMQGQHRQDDWYRYTLALPMARDPGGPQAVYCSAGINLLGAVVAKATGQWLPAFFDQYVARPLQMHGYHINLMPGGEAYLAGGIYLRPRDMLKLGQLYLSGGTWNGRRIVDQAWVRASTTEHSHFGPGHGYGYGWHLHTFHAGGRDYREYAAEGNGGQFVIVLPELDVTVAITAGNYGDFKTWYALQGLVARYIIPGKSGD
ncbi:serine hydrolase domain-containing protein [Frateuria hangzhouensis]|uniref:serine hydrolase domain-containing protein n=1 Tax=Frateuria hangzhouensis TaxID=2995589 RepID=UPI002260AC89|nr:serine hydrolase domain-containing protein [Frateuria sp. STR12]MCX7515159.1 serine hydrolase [Frateuria sp. STR12]